MCFRIKEACPKPEPCPEAVCPPQQPCPEPDPTVWIKRSELPPDWNKKCPPPKECSPCPRPPPPPKCPETNCPPCPKPKQKGDCPAPERCPPAQNCPKCYDVKYLKVPVVKSEPVKKPEQESIFPADLIKTKILRQQAPKQPRQPRIVGVNDQLDNNEENLLPQLVRPNDNNEIAPAPSIISNGNNTLRAAPIASPPAEPVRNNKYEGLLDQIKNLKNIISAKDKKKEEKKIINEINNNLVNNKKEDGQCGKAEYNKAYNKYGIRGFNNVL